MKQLLIAVGLKILGFLLKQERLHEEIRALAKKTENEVDDAGAEALIGFLKKTAEIIDAK